jgi:hypothetical protein
MTFSLQKLTEGIRDRHVGQQNKRLVEKWSRTGLLRGMGDVNRENMATMLENQAAQVLRESSTMGDNNVGGFSNIAFPIVRRVFGGLIANELVSIQPMSLPSGLLFYLDYTYGSNQGGAENDNQNTFGTNDSIYGGPSGKAIQNGADASGGQYDLSGSSFSREHVSKDNVEFDSGDDTNSVKHLFTINDAGTGSVAADATANANLKVGTKGRAGKFLHFDSQVTQLIEDGSVNFAFLAIPYTTTNFPGIDQTAAKSIALFDTVHVDGTPKMAGLSPDLLTTHKVQSGAHLYNVRRLNQLVTLNNSGAGGAITASDISLMESAPEAKPGDAKACVLMVVALDGSTAISEADFDGAGDKSLASVSFVKADAAEAIANSVGEIDIDPSMEGLQTADLKIPEIDIKIESVPVTAQTRKLRARWSPELAQDLNAYHSMDAEVELTQILSEQIALEIDREILNDLLTGAKGANFFWSRSPGKFVNKRTGAEIARTSTLNPGPAFTGTVREWYETLTETVIDVANEIHRKTLRGSANFIVVSPDVATVLEASVLYRPSYSIDGDGQVGAPFTMGAEKMGTLSNRFTVYKDPYFPRNKILVGYKGGSYLETGFVYAPYVPLIVTPTIFQPEDFTPRKGVMTRYGKKMVRADFYGTVTCLDMNII